MLRGSRRKPRSLGRSKLRTLVERIESIEAERTELASDVKDILAEAKSSGFNVRAIRQIVRLRRQDAAVRDANERKRRCANIRSPSNGINHIAILRTFRANTATKLQSGE